MCTLCAGAIQGIPGVVSGVERERGGSNPENFTSPEPIGSMYGIFTYIYHENQPNVGKYTIHGSYGELYKSTRDFFGVEKKTWQTLGKTLLKMKLLVGPTCKIPRSTQRSCSGIRQNLRCAKKT